MQETNYVNDLINDYYLDRKKDDLYNLLVSAVKFRLPPNGVVIDSLSLENSKDEYPLGKIIKDYNPIIKLPYRAITLEYIDTGLNPPVKTLVLCEQIDDNHITIYNMHNFKEIGEWRIIPYCLVVNTQNESYLLKECSNMDLSILSQEAKDGITNQLVVSYYSLLCLIVALNCSNVEQSDCLAPVKLNKKRLASGKLPLFDYKILTLKASQSKSTNNKHGTGNHASPRQHLRRGHIRRLKDRQIWINDCMVGDSKKGIIKKDYNVVA